MALAKPVGCLLGTGGAVLEKGCSSSYSPSFFGTVTLHIGLSSLFLRSLSCWCMTVTRPSQKALSAKSISKHCTASARTSIPYSSASPIKSERDWKLLFPVPLLGFSPTALSHFILGILWQLVEWYVLGAVDYIAICIHSRFIVKGSALCAWI